MKRKLACIFLTAVIIFTSLPMMFASASGEVLHLSDDGLEFIKRFEGFTDTAYLDGGVWYIGYGTSCREGEYPDGITEDEAEELLRERVYEYETSLNEWLALQNISLTERRFDALISFTMNAGKTWMENGYRMSDMLKKGADSFSDVEIVNIFGAWCHWNKEVKETLVERRMAEACVFLYGDYYGDYADDFVYLVFNANGGTCESDIRFYERGKSFSDLPVPARSNYTFKGWKTDSGTVLSSTQTADRSMSVSAVWEANSSSPSWSNPYSDVRGNDWYFKYVKDLSIEGVINGFPDGSFRPGEPVTTGAALKLIMLATGYKEQAPTDANWASGYMSRALSDGLLDEPVDLDAKASRLMIAEVSAKALGLSKVSQASPFSDTDDGAVLALYKAGIVEGSYEDGRLVYKPESSITRAEISAVIWRIKNKENTQNTDTHEGQIQYNSHWLDILDDVEVNEYDSGDFYSSNGRIYYDSDIKTYTGVDVSVYQGDIDWHKVKADGIDFAIIRLGYRGYGAAGTMHLDSNFVSNIEGAMSVGLPVGVYFFSQAITPKEAKEEAEFVLTYLKDYELTYPVVFDWEIIGSTSARTYGLDTKTLCECANTFCGIIEKAGYEAMIYFNTYAGYMKYDLSEINDYDFWFAQYQSKPNFYYGFDMWQYTSSGHVDGIVGNVDLNICFEDYQAK